MYLFIHLLFFPIHKIIIINIFSTYIKKKLFVCFWLRQVSVAAQGLFSSCSEQGLRSAAALGLLPGTVSPAVQQGLCSAAALGLLPGMVSLAVEQGSRVCGFQ